MHSIVIERRENGSAMKEKRPERTRKENVITEQLLKIGTERMGGGVVLSVETFKTGIIGRKQRKRKEKGTDYLAEGVQGAAKTACSQTRERKVLKSLNPSIFVESKR